MESFSQCTDAQCTLSHSLEYSSTYAVIDFPCVCLSLFKTHGVTFHGDYTVQSIFCFRFS